jgi:hypothetical protein
MWKYSTELIMSVPQNIVMDMNYIMNPEWLSYFEQSFVNTCPLVSVFGATPIHIPPKYRCVISIRPIYLLLGLNVG